MLDKIIGCSKAETVKVVQNLFSYLFDEINKSQLKSQLQDPRVYSILDKQLLKNGYILKNCKAYLYSRYVAKEQGLRIRYKDFGVLQEDVYFLNKVSLNITKKSCKALSIKNLDWLTSHVYSKEFQQYIGKYIKKKMSFLIKSYGVEFLELQSELQLAGIYAIYKKYPYFTSKLHALNIAKAAIHNRGINLILFYTRKKRQRLLRDENGFFSQTDTNIEDMQIPFIDIGAQKREVQKTFSQLRSKCGKRGALFLKLSLGEYDESFSSYLNTNNAQLMDSCSYSSYMNKVYKYLGVTQQQVQVFFNKLKPHLQ